MLIGKNFSHKHLFALILVSVCTGFDAGTGGGRMARKPQLRSFLRHWHGCCKTEHRISIVDAGNSLNNGASYRIAG